MISNREVSMTGADFEFSFDHASLFVLGNLRTYKYGTGDRDCFILRVSLTTPSLQERISGAYLGTKS